jgi:hypothetical protein
MKSLDNKGKFTLFGVFNECESDISNSLKELPKGVTKSKNIRYRVFAKVVHLYCKIVFKMIIEGKNVPLYNRFGKLNVVKTKCIRYNPFKFVFKKDELGKVIREKVKINLKSGYWFFVFWDCPKRLRHYRFNIDMKYKIEYMKKVEDGFDYLDYTLDKYGKYASVDYIHHIK